MESFPHYWVQWPALYCSSQLTVAWPAVTSPCRLLACGWGDVLVQWHATVSERFGMVHCCATISVHTNTHSLTTISIILAARLFRVSIHHLIRLWLKHRTVPLHQTLPLDLWCCLKQWTVPTEQSGVSSLLDVSHLTMPDFHWSYLAHLCTNKIIFSEEIISVWMNASLLEPTFCISDRWLIFPKLLWRFQQYWLLQLLFQG